MLLRKEYFKTVHRFYPPFWNSLIFRGVGDFAQYVPFFPEPFATTNIIKSDYDFWYSKSEVKKGGELILKYWSIPKYFEQGKNLLFEREKCLLNAAQGDDFEALYKAYAAYMPAVALPFVADDPVAIKMEHLLKEQCEEDEANELMNTINIPFQDNFYKQESYELATTDDLLSHVKKYEWIFSRYGKDNPYTLEQAENNLAEINKEEFLKKYHDGKKEVKNAIARAKKILKNNAYFVDLMQFIVYYRTQRTDIINRVSYEFMPMLKNEAQKLGLTYEEILHCSHYEIPHMVPSYDIIRGRIIDHAGILEDGVERLVFGAESQKIREFLQEDFIEVKKLQGRSAYNGIVRGKARLVFNRGDFEKIQEGDILVTSMTTPDFIPIMKKAAAFVTDEGGITCHAAIMSREMKKPCVIGTKIATQILKDGMEIEVDADEGVVRML